MDRHETVWQKLKVMLNPNTCRENIQSGYRKDILNRNSWHANNERRKTANDGRNRTTKSRQSKTHWEKKDYKYLDMLKAETIKQAEMKEKLKIGISGEQENYSKPNYRAEIPWKVSTVGLSLL